jgi:23S rRNA pseudouridine2605 synthase
VVRLQKFLAEAGVASRRASEQVILAGRVTVNGEVVTALGSKADPLHDKIEVDGQRVTLKRKHYIALNKPRGYICSRKDDQSRDTVHDLLPKEWANLYTVGRLDFDSEGLIFLTNDGEFSLRLTHPRYGVRKKYLALVEGRVEEKMLSQFTRGVESKGEILKVQRAKRQKRSGTRTRRRQKSRGAAAV